MNAVMNFEDRLPADAVKALVDRHGLWQVLRAVSKAALARRVKLRQAADLSDHLRRDIGLPPVGPDWQMPGYE